MTHHVLYIPGLNDHKRSYEPLIALWHMYGVTPHVYRMNWHDTEPFKKRLKRLLTEIDKYIKTGDTVSLIGGSAGGSAALNAFILEPRISAIINVCGRLRAGTHVFPTLELAAKHSRAFKESVTTFEKNEPMMSDMQRQKVLCLTPLYDEIVPGSTAILRGAIHKRLYSVEHMLSGFLSMTLYSPILFMFIRKKLSL